ncbi:preprotein translocase subunit SecE [Actinoallomurus iriomotensis]|uniref:Protein translocase subunit SecE n=1 Tax=Actinoallomurus iriomotensis TaxID=478107 RepID=A0A9W6W598_9ACTN|nr:preprotein translocase subunit SecE [Actinoallomurus iriomotensis]GLY91269.1 protein translocase subunit SecE [Actinoallomurus iriomotensis]
MATDTRGDAATKDKEKKPRRKRTSPLLFYRQVVAELRKVIWPTRHELVTYTTVSLIFVIIVLAIVFGLDNLFSWATLKAFG